MWERGVNPSFADLLKLVDSKVRAVNSPFGAELHGDASRSKQSDNQNRFSNGRHEDWTRVTTLAATSTEEVRKQHRSVTDAELCAMTTAPGWAVRGLCDSPASAGSADRQCDVQSCLVRASADTLSTQVKAYREVDFSED